MELTEILGYYAQANQKFETWIAQTTHKRENRTQGETFTQLPCQAINHVSDALNGKPMDWSALFRELITAELDNRKEKLFKDRSALPKSVVGSPLKMLLKTSVWQDKSVPSSKKKET